VTVWHLIAEHPNGFGFVISLLAAVAVVWFVQRPEWDKDD